MADGTPSSVLFCCDHNSIRSPMAEGIGKKLLGTAIFIQSAGVKNDKDIDGFAISVCEEIDVALIKHKVRSFQDLEEWGDDLDSYDLIIALSPLSAKTARKHTETSATEVVFWDVADPTTGPENRESKLAAYRAVREDIHARIQDHFNLS